VRSYLARIIAEPIGASRFPAPSGLWTEVDEPARRDAIAKAFEFGGQLDGDDRIHAELTEFGSAEMSSARSIRSGSTPVGCDRVQFIVPRARCGGRRFP